VLADRRTMLDDFDHQSQALPRVDVTKVPIAERTLEGVRRTWPAAGGAIYWCSFWHPLVSSR
jgi:hypothetical protein